MGRGSDGEVGHGERGYPARTSAREASEADFSRASFFCSRACPCISRSASVIASRYCFCVGVCCSSGGAGATRYPLAVTSQVDWIEAVEAAADAALAAEPGRAEPGLP